MTTKGTRNVYIRKTDLDRFGYTAGCRACEVHRAGQSMSGQEHTAECRRRLEDAMTTDTFTKAARVRQAERIVRDLDESGSTNPSSSSGPSGSGQHKRVRFADREPAESRLESDAEMQTGSQEAPATRKRSAETDAERLEKVVTSAEADFARRLCTQTQSRG